MEFSFSFDGRSIPARPGDSIAAALEAAGTRTYGQSRGGRERGVFCGMGACQDCLVVVDGRVSQRACMREAAPGMVVARQIDGATRAGPAPTESKPARVLDCDLLVIGAGPGGLSAAIAAARAGLEVIVLDEREDAGGQYFKPRSHGFRGRYPRDRQHRAGDALRKEFRSSGAHLHHGESVWFARRLSDTFVARSIAHHRSTEFRARATIVATGAMERPAYVPGWSLPGVMTIGAVQTLARRYGVPPTGRVLIAGNGPLGLQLACELLDLGANVVGIAERAPFRPLDLARAAAADPGLAAAGAGYLARLAAKRVPMLWGWSVEQLEGDGAVSAAVLRHIDRVQRLAADTVCLGDGFQPQMDLARLLGVPVEITPAGPQPKRESDGSTPVPGVWLVGDAGGLGGAQVAMYQGDLAGRAAACHLGAEPDGTAATTRRRLARARRFQAALWRAYAATPRPAPDGQTLICRCENVTAAQIDQAIEAGASDPGAVKRATRCAMGRCQGRVCTPGLHAILARCGHPVAAETLFAPQVPARPVPVSAIAVEKSEWGGHRESSPAARPSVRPEAPLDTTQADLVVVGAGITGISAALWAARAGAKVVCLDRGRVNGEASGGNAGSLHLQLLSWDFGSKAFATGSAALRTLPLQQESIALWRSLEAENGGNFEMRVTGGLMVAEDEAQIAFLRQKAQAEADYGIETEIVGCDDIRRLVPAISDRMVAGAWCAGEGKINPLVATTALARTARTEGVMVEELTPVTALRPDADDYLVQTSRGTLRCRHLVLAAGGWSAELARMLNVEIPVRGAPLQMVVTETAPPLVPCLLAHADRHLTMKQTEIGTLLIGGAWTASVGPAGQPLVLPESLEGNLWVAARTVPAVAGLSILRSWAAMNIDIDGAPLISPLPGHPRVVVAATANGYTLGPLVGREAAGACLTGRLRHDLQPFTLDRFNH